MSKKDLQIGRFRPVTEHYGYRVEERYKGNNFIIATYHKDLISPRHTIGIFHDSYRAQQQCLRLEDAYNERNRNNT